MALVDIYPRSMTGARYEETSTSALFTPGTESFDNMGGTWVYCKASAACAQYALVTISNALIPLCAEATTTTIANGPVPLGLTQVAFASADYGWVFRGPGGGVGRGIKCLAANAVLDVTMYTTATAGVLDDANVDESVVAGLKLTATVTTQAAVECICSTLLTCNLGEPD
jgi:hypothetical protein